MKKYIYLIAAITILMLSSSVLFGQFGMQKDLVHITKIYKSFDKIQRGSEFKIAVAVTVDSTWHINSNKPNDKFLIPSVLKISSKNNFSLVKIVYPKQHEVNFSFSDKPVSVYQGNVIFGGIVKVPEDIELGTYKVKVTIDYQACNDQSCMPPSSADLEFDIQIVDNKTSVQEINSDIFSKLDLAYTQIAVANDNNDSSIADTLEHSGLLMSLLFVFLGGLALNLTPCVYPLIPITIGYFGGQSEGRTGKLFMLGVFYVLGMALTYSVVGVVTSLSGAVFGTLLQSPIVIIFVVLILLALSLSMFGVYEFKMPDSWVLKAGGAKTGIVGAFIMGLTMGIVAAPCIGPFVLGLVTYVGVKGDPVYGFLMFFFLAVGLGMPYLFLALFSGKIKNLPRSGFWMDAVKHIFGFLLVGMALYFLLPLLPKSYAGYVLPIYLIIVGVYLLFFEKQAGDVKGFKIFKIILALVMLFVGIYTLIPSEQNEPKWIKYSETKYEVALKSHSKVFIDFYADWCIPCKELDHSTFSDERVIKKLKEFKTFKVDMTKSLSDETEKVREKFNIRGMPTLIFINSEGKEVQRNTGFINADEFLKIISTIK